MASSSHVDAAQARSQVIPVLVGRSSKVTDGDSICVELSFESIGVRLDSIDAPESKQHGGREATDALAKRVFGKEVLVDVVTQDRYKRFVVLV